MKVIEIKLNLKKGTNLKKLMKEIKKELDRQNDYKLPIENPVMESTKSI